MEKIRETKVGFGEKFADYNTKVGKRLNPGMATSGGAAPETEHAKANKGEVTG